MTEDLIDRERIILKKLSERGVLSVTSLSKELKVSTVTIRQDLKNLEEKGYLNRARGGAYPSTCQSILERKQLFPAEKLRIARAAANLVRDGDRIMIEAGTTTALVVRSLAGKREVQIVSNSTLVISYARLISALEITLTGGEFKRETESMVGQVALGTLRAHNVRLAFVGTDGFSLEKGLTTQLAAGGEIVRAMCAQAEEAWLLADSSKYGKTGFYNMLPIDGVTGIITDNGLPDEAVAALEERGIKILRV